MRVILAFALALTACGSDKFTTSGESGLGGSTMTDEKEETTNPSNENPNPDGGASGGDDGDDTSSSSGGSGSGGDDGDDTSSSSGGSDGGGGVHEIVIPGVKVDVPLEGASYVVSRESVNWNPDVMFSAKDRAVVLLVDGEEITIDANGYFYLPPGEDNSVFIMVGPGVQPFSFTFSKA